MRSLLALPSFDPSSSAKEHADALIPALVADAAANPGNYDPWLAIVREQTEALLPSLTALFSDAGRTENERYLAANMLAGVLSDGDTRTLVNLLVVAEGRQFAPILAALREHDPNQVKGGLQDALVQAPKVDASEEEKKTRSRGKTPTRRSRCGCSFSRKTAGRSWSSRRTRGCRAT